MEELWGSKLAHFSQTYSQRPLHLTHWHLTSFCWKGKHQGQSRIRNSRNCKITVNRHSYGQGTDPYNRISNSSTYPTLWPNELNGCVILPTTTKTFKSKIDYYRILCWNKISYPCRRTQFYGPLHPRFLMFVDGFFIFESNELRPFLQNMHSMPFQPCAFYSVLSKTFWKTQALSTIKMMHD